MQSLFAAECCKKIAFADADSTDDDRDLAYSAGLCHNLGLMALSHIEPLRTNEVLRRHRERNESDTLGQIFHVEFATDHRIVTAELSRNWSLPAPMVAAYQYRAFPESHCDVRLGFIVASGVCAVENAEVDDCKRASLSPWAVALGIPTEDLQAMATIGDRQIEKIQSLASKMTR